MLGKKFSKIKAFKHLFYILNIITSVLHIYDGAICINCIIYSAVNANI